MLCSVLRQLAQTRAACSEELVTMMLRNARYKRCRTDSPPRVTDRLLERVPAALVKYNVFPFLTLQEHARFGTTCGQLYKASALIIPARFLTKLTAWGNKLVTLHKADQLVHAAEVVKTTRLALRFRPTATFNQIDMAPIKRLSTLRMLEVNTCDLGNDGVRHIIDGLPMLERLGLDEVSFVTDEAFRGLEGTRVRDLSLVRCYSLTGRCLAFFGMLEALELAGLPVFEGRNLRMLPYQCNLQKLVIRDTLDDGDDVFPKNLTSDDLLDLRRAEKLRILSLAALAGIGVLFSVPWFVEVLHLERFSTLTDAGLISALQRCGSIRALRCLSLVSNPLLTKDGLQKACVLSKNLRLVRVDDCLAILQNATVQVFEGHALPMFLGYKREGHRVIRWPQVLCRCGLYPMQYGDEVCWLCVRIKKI